MSPVSAWLAARSLSYWPEKTMNLFGSSVGYWFESRIPTGMPCWASSFARASAASRVPEASSTTVHASLPAGQSAISGVVVPVPSSVAGGIVGVAVGTVVVVGAGVGVAPCSATCSASPASSTSARTSAMSAIRSRPPTSATGPRQLGGAAIVELTSAPHCRHHSCSGVRSAPQRGQRRVSVAGAGVSVGGHGRCSRGAASGSPELSGGGTSSSRRPLASKLGGSSDFGSSLRGSAGFGSSG